MKNNANLIAALLELMRSRISKWDVADHALDSTGRTVRLIAILVAMTLPPATWALLAELLSRR